MFIGRTEWRRVPGFPTYWASAKGSVRSETRGQLAQKQDRDGYWFVRAVSAEGKRQRLYCHRAVLLAFVGPRPPGLVSRHLDGDLDNNALTNLVYGTQKENMADRDRHGRTARGERNGRSLLREEPPSSVPAD